MKQLSRQEKEELYIKKVMQLQRITKNPFDSSFGVGDLTDEELDKALDNVITTIRSKKIANWILRVIVGAIIIWFLVSFFGKDKGEQQIIMWEVLALGAGYFFFIKLNEINNTLASILHELRSKK